MTTCEWLTVLPMIILAFGASLFFVFVVVMTILEAIKKGEW